MLSIDPNNNVSSDNRVHLDKVEQNPSQVKSTFGRSSDSLESHGAVQSKHGISGMKNKKYQFNVDLNE